MNSHTPKKQKRREKVRRVTLKGWCWPFATYKGGTPDYYGFQTGKHAPERWAGVERCQITFTEPRK
jgi:hypothetical protein